MAEDGSNGIHVALAIWAKQWKLPVVRAMAVLMTHQITGQLPQPSVDPNEE